MRPDRAAGAGRIHPKSYRVLSHTADTGIEATADSLAELIAVLAVGMYQLMATTEPSAARRWIKLRVESATIEDLVVDILSELVYHSETEDLVFCDVRVDVEPDVPTADVEAGGVPTDAVVPAGPPIKAVTYHDLAVERRAGGWYGRVYFDV
jgi:SHS2 domain-containing protein